MADRAAAKAKGQAWFPPANQMGEGCATEPETYPPQPKGGMSHGPKLLGQ